MSEPVRKITNDTAPGSSHSSIDWAAAFKSPEFCAGLQTAVAEAIANSSESRSLASNVTTLEQMGEVNIYNIIILRIFIQDKHFN